MRAVRLLLDEPSPYDVAASKALLYVTDSPNQHAVAHMVAWDRRLGQWDQEFVDSVSFRESPIVAAPDVTEMPLRPDDEFLVIASDGLW